MKRYILIAFLYGAVAGHISAQAYDSVDEMLSAKRSEANRQRMATMQQIQHRQSNPEAFMARSAVKTEPSSVSFAASNNGHFYIPVNINGKQVQFMADTGATDVFLTQEDARSLGINMSNLNYNILYNTANGQVRAAETIVPNFSVGSITLANLPVSVSQNSSGTSLLGMRFFNQLSSYRVEKGTLTLYK